MKLAARTGDLGYPIHRTAIAKIESGERVVTIPELFVLSAALSVPPLALIFPNVLASIDVLPGRRMRGLSAMGWFIGWGVSIGPRSQSQDYSYGLGAADDVADSLRNRMRIPLRLLQLEDALLREEHNLRRENDRSIELGIVDTPEIQDQISEATQQALAAIRRRIDSLEFEREQLMGKYVVEKYVESRKGDLGD